MDNIAISEANQKETERALTEKEKFAEEHKNNAGSSIENYSVSNVSDTEDDDIIQQEAKRAEENANKIKSIIKRYYSQEYEEISKNASIEAQNTGIVDITNSPLTENQKNYTIWF